MKSDREPVPGSMAFREPRLYAADLRPHLQSILAALADIDVQHDCDLEALTSGPAEEHLKRHMQDDLRRRHRERREPYLRQLAAAQAHIRAYLR